VHTPQSAEGIRPPTPSIPQPTEGIGPRAPGIPRSAGGFGAPSAAPPEPAHGFGPPWYGAPGTPVPGPGPGPGRRRRKRHRVLQGLAALLLALGLTAGGVWYAMARKAVLPYGDTVGLSEPLRSGECVRGVPSPASVAGVPHLELSPDCKESPDGQVMELYKAPTYEVAKRRGSDVCEERTKKTAGKLAWNVKSMAVVPTRRGFDTTGGNVACLLVGEHGPVYGPLGNHRSYGTPFKDPAQIQKEDCVGHVDGDALTNTHYELVACEKDHAGRVVQITHLKTDATGDAANAKADEQCAKDAPPENYRYSSDVYWSHGLRSATRWANGYYLVVCSIEHLDKTLMHGDE
jgi:hypothetical protein